MIDNRYHSNSSTPSMQTSSSSTAYFRRQFPSSNMECKHLFDACMMKVESTARCQRERGAQGKGKEKTPTSFSVPLHFHGPHFYAWQASSVERRAPKISFRKMVEILLTGYPPFIVLVTNQYSGYCFTTTTMRLFFSSLIALLLCCHTVLGEDAVRIHNIHMTMISPVDTDPSTFPQEVHAKTDEVSSNCYDLSHFESKSPTDSLLPVFSW